MRPQKVDDDELIQGLMTVIRAKGFEGASLNDLAKAAGLQKASLYHRFPEGKEEIALAVLSYVNGWVKKNIYQALTDKSVPADKRLKIAIQNIRKLYANGKKSCVLSALSMESSVSIFSHEIKTIMQLWMDGFTALGTDFGFNHKSASNMAVNALISIEGSLIVAKGIGSTAPFIKVLKEIENEYIRK